MRLEAPGRLVVGGGVVGASFMTVVEDWLTRLEYWRLMLGLVIIAVVILMPEGIVGTLRTLWAKLRNSDEESIR